MNYRAVCKDGGDLVQMWTIGLYVRVVWDLVQIWNRFVRLFATLEAFLTPITFPEMRVYNHTSGFTLYVVCIPLLLNNAGGECTQFTCRTIFCCCAFIFWHLIVDCNCLVLHFYIRFIRVLCEIIIGKEITCVCLSVTLKYTCTILCRYGDAYLVYMVDINPSPMY